ncbi:hypothetical protein [Oceanobacillus halotolerans]|uniref:hypothetical protein n=1 Tax=Oceanobacillus halotolerans TaxID=2663380 RepID=UPI0013DC8502|nr:hypothetical protein [Oceanobacillus halotolerans]
MTEVTMFIKEANNGTAIQQVEQILNDLTGIERVLVDADDGEVKIAFDNRRISTERIAITLQQHDFHLM